MDLINNLKALWYNSFWGGVASKPYYNRQKAFTLAEIIIVLTVLGIVAMITVPSLIKHQQKVANRTKIKRAIADYDKVVQNIVIENDLHSDTELAQWADSKDKNSCANTSKYFKVADGNGCVFKTSDGVWWDIDNILKPIIALKQSDLSNLDNDTTFQLMTSYDSSAKAFRTDDLAYESTGENKNAIKKLFSFLNGKEDTSIEENQVDVEDIFAKYKNNEMEFAEIVKNLYPDLKLCTGSNKTNCIHNIYCTNFDSYFSSFSDSFMSAFDAPAYAAINDCAIKVYDEEGETSLFIYTTDDQPYFALISYIDKDKNGTKVEHDCSKTTEECHKYYYYNYIK